MTMPIASVQVTFEEDTSGQDELIKRLTRDASHVDIGIHSASGQNLVVIASANEFGATINHPGGQPFIIVKGPFDKSKKNTIPLNDGKVLVFLKKGSKGMGVTKPHTIIILARSFIRSTMDSRREFYQQQAVREWNAILDGRKDMQTALATLGLLVQTDIQNTIRALQDPPNAPATIRAKGSDNPLIDTGVMLNSIRYAVKNNQDQPIETS